LKIVFAGTPSAAALTLKALIQSQHEILAVITRPDSLVGRKKQLTESPVAAVAQAAGLKLIKTRSIDSTLADTIQSLGAQIGVVVAYGSIFNSRALHMFPLGWLNIHFSLLPDWRGAAPVQQSLIAGDRETGVTLFRLEDGIDTGPVYSRVATPIEPDETAGDLLDRLALIGVSALMETLPLLESGLMQPVAQTAGDEAKQLIRAARKPDREQAQIDWLQDSTSIEHLVRGMNPEPMAWTTFNGQSFRVIEARAVGPVDALTLLDDSSETQPGACFESHRRIFVVCGQQSVLELKSVQPFGKKPMQPADWLRGQNRTESVVFSK